MPNQSRTENHPKRRWVGWIIGIICVVIIGGLPLPRPALQLSGYRILSWNRMQNIALTLKAYQKDHSGKLPDHFSELVPDYYDGPELFYFSSPIPGACSPQIAHRHLL